MRACSPLAVALLVPCVAIADTTTSDDGRPAPATVVVDLVPAPGIPAWQAGAFEQSITRELAGFERLALVGKQDLGTHTCGADTGCRLGHYRAAAIDVVLFGRVRDGEIDYELYQTWTPARLAEGTIGIGRDQSPVGLKHATRRAFHPVLKHGGLLDQRPPTPDPAGPAARARDRDPVWSVRALAIVIGAAIFLALPFVVLASRARRLLRVARLRSARRVAAIVAAGAVVVVGLDPRQLADLVTAWPLVFAAAGGLAWGAFVVATARAVLPPLDGLERVAHQDLPRILATWCLACVERLVALAVVYVPFGWLAAWIGSAVAVPAPWTLFLIAPVVLLLARLWLSSWVECLAVILDHRLVDGPASAHNPWAREIADYVMGYVRRTGWDIDPALLASVVFLPGKHVDGVVAYGGGITPARIVVDKALLELAMGPLVEVKPDEKPALWPDWTTAAVVPHGRRQRRAMTSADDFRGRKQRMSTYPGVLRRPLGQAATLLGYPMPAPGQLVPLISDNPQDLSVVRELLSEHYPWFAPDPDDEYDATDPTDKDFLFGALARELGAVRRYETPLATVKLALGGRVARLAARYRTRLADSYATINFARHHLIQYLYYLGWRHTDRLTTRARADKLVETSNEVLRWVAAAETPPEPRIRARLVWLSRFFAAPFVARRQVVIRRVITAVVVAALVAAAGVAVKRSVDYHPVYVQRIETLERELAEARRKEADAGNQQKGPPDGEEIPE